MTYPPQGNPYQDPYQTPYQTPQVQYASWIQRVGAYVVDVLPTVPFSILSVALGQDTQNGVVTYNSLYWVFSLLSLIVWGYSRWFLAGKTGQSWGRKALGLRLVGEQSGQPIGALMAFVRDLAHFIDSIICFIGWLFPLWDAKKQTISDKLVKTVVVK